MKDGQGRNRGRCGEKGCDCLDYTRKGDANACDYCGHFPTAHTLVSSTSTQTTSVSTPSLSSSQPKYPTTNTVASPQFSPQYSVQTKDPHVVGN